MTFFKFYILTGADFIKISKLKEKWICIPCRSRYRSQNIFNLI